jgi:phage terminase small subunit
VTDTAPHAVTPPAISIEEACVDVPPDELAALDHREKLFVALLLTDPHMSGARAAGEAGYSKKSAKQRAYEKLRDPRIVAALDAAKKARLERLGFEADEVLIELTPIIRSDVRDFEHDEKTGKLTLRAGADPRAWRAVSSVKYKTKVLKDGEVVHETELKFWSKPEALRLAGEHFGLYKQVIDATMKGKTGVLVVPMTGSPAAWAELAAAHQDATLQVDTANTAATPVDPTAVAAAASRP